MKALNAYRIFDLSLASNMPLPELPAWKPAPADQQIIALQVEFSRPVSSATAAPKWVHQWRDANGAITLALAKSDAGFVLRTPTIADFLINADLKHIEIMPSRGSSPAAVRHALLDQVLPRVVAQRGRTVLHASAVSANNTAVAFMGATGAGKSTIASWLHRSGHTLLCDDCLALDTTPGCIGVIPSYAGARLWETSPAAPETGTNSLSPVHDRPAKIRLQVDADPAQQVQALRALWVLDPKSAASRDGVALAALTGVEAVMALVQHSFQLDMSESGRSAAHLDTLSALVNGGLPMLRLSYPHTPAALQEVKRLVDSPLPNSPARAGTDS